VSKSMQELLKGEKPFVDPSISGIEIKSSESAIKVTGKMPLTQSSVFGTIRVVNTDSTEVVDLISDKGLAKGEFTKFRLRKTSAEALNNQSITVLDKVKNFESSRGVKIGIMPSELQILFSNLKPLVQRSNGEKTYIQYILKAKDSS